MQPIKRYYIGINPPRLVEMTPAYVRDTGANGLVKGEDYDALAVKLEQSHQREAALQEMLNKADSTASEWEQAATRPERVLDLKARNNRLFRWSCLGYLLALGCLTYLFATGSI